MNNGTFLWKKIKSKKSEKYFVKDYEVIFEEYVEKPIIYTFFDVYKDKNLVYSDMWAIKHYSLNDIKKLGKQYHLKFLNVFSSLVNFNKKLTSRMVVVFRKEE